VAVGAASCGGRLCARLCIAVVFAALRGGRLRMALRGRRLRAALRGGCPCGVAWQASSRGVAQASSCAASRGRRLRAALCGGVFASPGGCRRAAVVFTCRRTAIVFASPLLSGLCRLRHRGHHHCLVAEGQRHIPSHAPANGGGCAGARGDGHAPASARTLFARERTGGRAQKGGGGGSACNRGRGQKEGSRTFLRPRKRRGLHRGGE
jgi:hypothetical protein